MNISKVSFFIAGVPKSGTTSLYRYLDSHPQVCMSSIKEPNYFSAEDLRAQQLYYGETIIDNEKDYYALFSDCEQGSIKGEASVSYLFYPNTAKKIYDYNPDARIIVILRDPSLRAFSHWQMDERLGFVKSTLDEILDQKGKGESHQYFQQYILLGKYAEQLNRYYALFKKDQVMIILQEDLRRDLSSVLKKLYRFLEIAEQNQFIEEEYNTARKIKNPILAKLYTNRLLRRSVKFILPGSFSDQLLKTVSDPDDRKPSGELIHRLYALYKDDIFELEKISGRNLSNWKYL